MHSVSHIGSYAWMPTTAKYPHAVSLNRVEMNGIMLGRRVQRNRESAKRTRKVSCSDNNVVQDSLKTRLKCLP